MVLAVASCGESGSGPTLPVATRLGITVQPSNATAGAASQLAFVIQPRATLSGGAISPAVQVAVQDAFGNTVTAATHSVTAAIRNNPGGGTLSGTTAASAANGVATFSDLSIDKPGTGYTLAVSADGLFDATSTAFDIIAPLSFTTVAAGGAGRGSHTCAVTTDGTIYCWGFNGNGQLGDGTRTNRAVPALTAWNDARGGLHQR